MKETATKSRPRSTTGKPSADSNPLDNSVISYSSKGEPFSYYKDDSWVIFDRDVTVKFHNFHGSFKEDFKRIIYEKIIVQNSIISKTTYAHNWLQGAICCQKIIQQLGGKDFRFIDSDEGFRRFVVHAKTLNIKYKTWKNYLIIFSKLRELNFIDRVVEDANLLAKQLSAQSRATQQAVALPEAIAREYIKKSIDIIDRYYKYRYEISDAYGDFYELYQECKHEYRDVVSARKKALKMVKHSIPYSDFSLDLNGVWLSRLRGACYVLIASFTGCRDGEIKSFDLASYREKEYGNMKIATVSGQHTKPNPAGVVRETSWVTSEISKKAIELLWHSFDFSRDIWMQESKKIERADIKKKMVSNINSLFITLPLPFSTATRPNAGRQAMNCSLVSFAKSTGYTATKADVKEFNMLNPTRVGELQKGQVLVPHPHGFRRTFAIFLVRNKLGSMLDLKYQLKHINITMTAWYANQSNVAAHLDMVGDTELMDLIAQENHNFMTDTLDHIYNEAIVLSGREGARILAARKESPASIYMSREAISNQVKSGQMSIVENPFGHCTNPVCTRICDMQTCKYKIVTKEKALELLPVRNKFVEKFKALKSSGVKQPNIMSKIYYDIRAIDQSLSDHDIKFSPFDETFSAEVS